MASDGSAMGMGDGAMRNDPRQLWLFAGWDRRPPRELGFRGVQVLAFVRKCIVEHGRAPSYGMIMRELDFATTADVCRVVQRLEGRGLLRRAGAGRVRRIALTPTVEGVRC